MGSYLNAAQLVNFPTIVRQKSSASISPPLTYATLFSCLCWVIDGALLPDLIFMLANGFGVFAALVQIGLLVIYPRIIVTDDIACITSNINAPQVSKIPATAL